MWRSRACLQGAKAPKRIRGFPPVRFQFFGLRGPGTLVEDSTRVSL